MKNHHDVSLLLAPVVAIDVATWIVDVVVPSVDVAVVLTMVLDEATVDPMPVVNTMPLVDDTTVVDVEAVLTVDDETPVVDVETVLAVDDETDDVLVEAAVVADETTMDETVEPGSVAPFVIGVPSELVHSITTL